MRFARSSGILLHPTSLPGRFGIGDLGPEAYRFIDFLAAAGQRLWQIMPLGPTGYGDSPYQSVSAFAGNTLLISPERLRDDGLLSEDDLRGGPEPASDRVDFRAVIEWKTRALRAAAERAAQQSGGELTRAVDAFRAAQPWLADYALFMALRAAHRGAPWNTWAPELAWRDAEALAAARARHAAEIAEHELHQFLFHRQWMDLKAYCRHHAVRVIGDLPIFVAHNSADVWAHPELFKLDGAGHPTVIAGVPPDLFSRTGQLWGNPLYDWEAMRATGYAWWVERLRAMLAVVDLARIDHFRGFAACWEVPAGDDTAEGGQWVKAPGDEIFSALARSLGDLPIIAEDLGTITPDVHRLRDELGLPGMRVLQFAFDGASDNPHLPHMYERHSVVYTGTHDNDTTVGWFRARSSRGVTLDRAEIERQRRHCLAYLRTDGREIHWDFIHAALASVADLAVIPAQDLLGLDSAARMNVPASEEGNWAWRLAPGALTEGLAARLRAMSALYGRASC